MQHFFKKDFGFQTKIQTHSKNKKKEKHVDNHVPVQKILFLFFFQNIMSNTTKNMVTCILCIIIKF